MYTSLMLRMCFVVGGDNCGENRLGQIKSNMRRCGMLKGRYPSKYKRIQVLVAAALHRKPGIMSVLTALQLCKHDCSRGSFNRTKRRICSREFDLAGLATLLPKKVALSFLLFLNESVFHFEWRAR